MRNQAFCTVTIVCLMIVGASIVAFAAPSAQLFAKECETGGGLRFRREACAALARMATGGDKNAGPATELVVDLLSRRVTDMTATVPRLFQLQSMNQTALLKLAKSSVIPSVRATAVAGVLDQGTLEALSKTDQNPEVRKAVVQRLSPLGPNAQGAIAAVATDDSDTGVRVVAVDNLNDQASLRTVLFSAAPRDVLGAAIARIQDQAVLGDFVASSLANSDLTLRLLAVRRLDDQDLLTSVAKRPDEDPNVRAAAIERVLDSATLQAIASSSSSEAVKSAAQRQIASLQAQEAQRSLPLAIAQGDLASTARLIDQGVSLSDPNFLRTAVKSGNRGLVQLLVSKGAPADGDNLLLLAASNRLPDMVVLLKGYFPATGVDGDYMAANRESQCEKYVGQQVAAGATTRFVMVKESPIYVVDRDQYGLIKHMDFIFSIYYLADIRKDGDSHVSLGKCAFTLQGVSYALTDFKMCPPSPDSECLPKAKR